MFYLAKSCVPSAVKRVLAGRRGGGARTGNNAGIWRPRSGAASPHLGSLNWSITRCIRSTVAKPPLSLTHPISWIDESQLGDELLVGGAIQKGSFYWLIPPFLLSYSVFQLA